MSESVEELTIEREEEGRLLTKQLQKHILSRGAWATVLYLCQDIEKDSEEYKPPYAKLVRYRKLRGSYKVQGKFNISSGKQALAIVGILQEWFQTSPNGGEEAAICEEESD
jgi:hypothetical protein